MAYEAVWLDCHFHHARLGLNMQMTSTVSALNIYACTLFAYCELHVPTHHCLQDEICHLQYLYCMYLAVGWFSIKVRKVIFQVGVHENELHCWMSYKASSIIPFSHIMFVFEKIVVRVPSVLLHVVVIIFLPLLKSELFAISNSHWILPLNSMDHQELRTKVKDVLAHMIERL